jgi:hypothetical protein
MHNNEEYFVSTNRLAILVEHVNDLSITTIIENELDRHEKKVN